MYKRASRFLQVMARKGKTPNRKRRPVTTVLARRLDREVEKATPEPETKNKAKPGLVKRRPAIQPPEPREPEGQG
jgi:hypothetical protein